jgi:hypothetical protein
MGIHNNRRSRALLCWLVFAAGLLIYLLAPHLKISNGAFVIPPTLTAGANEIRPAEIVARQRRMQLISALLTVSGALGLAVLYRDILTGRTSRRASESVDGESDFDSTRASAPRRDHKKLNLEKNQTRRKQLQETNTK